MGFGSLGSAGRELCLELLPVEVPPSSNPLC